MGLALDQRVKHIKLGLKVAHSWRASLLLEHTMQGEYDCLGDKSHLIHASFGSKIQTMEFKFWLSFLETSLGFLGI